MRGQCWFHKEICCITTHWMRVDWTINYFRLDYLLTTMLKQYYHSKNELDLEEETQSRAQRKADVICTCVWMTDPAMIGLSESDPFATILVGSEFWLIQIWTKRQSIGINRQLGTHLSLKVCKNIFWHFDKGIESPLEPNSSGCWKNCLLYIIHSCVMAQPVYRSTDVVFIYLWSFTRRKLCSWVSLKRPN